MESSLDPKVLAYIAEREIHTFESCDFNIIAFEWYDISGDRAQTAQMLLYLDAEDSSSSAKTKCPLTGAFDFQGTGQQRTGFCGILSRLLKDDRTHLDEIEDRILQADDAILLGPGKSTWSKSSPFAGTAGFKALLRAVSSIFEDLAENENALLSKDGVRRLETLSSRSARFLANVTNMQDRVSQMREAYQSQIDIEQNQIMKVFTTVTVIFLPLTLLVGWYGMNLRMPEYEWEYGYRMLISISVLIGVGLYIFFKKRNWF